MKLSLTLLSAAVTSSLLAACGGGGETPISVVIPPVVQVNPLTFTTFPADAAGRELGRTRIGTLVVDNLYSTVNGVSALTQSRVTVGTESLKVFTDSSTGRLVRVDNERTKASTVFRVLQDRTEMWQYDAAGQYIGGVAVFKRGTDWYSADIAGTPAAFDQIEITLVNFGSAALTPSTTSSLTNERKLDGKISMWIDKFEAETAKRDDLQKLSAAGAKSCQGVAGLGAAMGAVVGFVFGSGTVVGAVPIALAASVPGAMLGWIACAAVTDTFERIQQPTSDALVEAGVASDSTNFVTRLANRIQSGSLATLLTRPAATSAGTGDVPTSYATPPVALTSAPPKIATNVDGIAVTPNNSIYRISGTVSPTGAISASGANSAGQSLQITAQSGPCPSSSSKDGSFKSLRTMRTSGSLSQEEAESIASHTTDAAENIHKALSTTGCTTGSFTAGTTSGTVQGRETTYGQCATVTQSGGQGTFSRVYDVGKASGNVTFSYNAYTIPDAFTVINGGTTVFDTNGLVSGVGSKAFALASRNVFITVSAPTSGTAWDFQLTCP